MVGTRLAKLERALAARVGHTCRACWGGYHTFVIHRWLLDGGECREEPEPSKVYDETGRCRMCGGVCRHVIVLEQFECVAELARGLTGGKGSAC